jgi:riboflavin kinase/FMN adenylyltransferase
VSSDLAIVTIGTFDGVHRGHQMLLKQVVDRARVLGVRSYAVTFDPHPQSVLYPSRAISLLSSPPEKEALIRACGIEQVWMCHFTPELSRLSPQEFMNLVVKRQPIAELWVGPDFAMGHERSGTIEALAEISRASGWGLHMVPPFQFEGQVVSSTAIRTLLAAGAVQGAAELLGRPYAITSEACAERTLSVPAGRAVPRALPYHGRLRTEGGDQDVLMTVLAGEEGPPTIQVEAPLPSDAPATVQFLRRAT